MKTDGTISISHVERQRKQQPADKASFDLLIISMHACIMLSSLNGRQDYSPHCHFSSNCISLVHHLKVVNIQKDVKFDGKHNYIIIIKI